MTTNQGELVPLRETILSVLQTMPNEAAPEHLAVMIERQVWDWQALNMRGVSTNRQGWRARLANVERLLSDAQDGFGGGEVSLATIGASKALSKALAEVRSMLDGDNEAKP